MRLPAFVQWIKPHWRSLIIITWPLIILPLPILSGTLESRCGYVVLLMGVFWMTEAIPLAITSLLPVILFPLLGVMDTNTVCMVYMKETNMMSIAGLIIAIAIEHCNLHKRIALRVLLLIGTSPRLLMLGFMINTMFLSMWISNTATVAMMVPIVQAVLEELKEGSLHVARRRNSSVCISKHETSTWTTELEEKTLSVVVMSTDTTQCKQQEQHTLKSLEKKFYKDTLCYYLGVAYAANIGGTGTVTGTGTNLIFIGILQSAYPAARGVNFASWMIFNVPVMLINVFLAWVWLQIMYMGLITGSGCRGAQQTRDAGGAVREMIARKHRELGAITWHEGSVLVLFVTLVFLWFFRAPEFISGWAQLLPASNIKDSTPAMLIILLMFILPANLDFLKIDGKDKKASPSLLNWPIVQSKLPWSLVLLLGGGFAMAEGSKVSGLSAWLGEQLVGLDVLPTSLVVAVICVMTTFTTEVSSNTAIANILLPVLAEMAKAIRTHPVYLMMPATLCCSYSFMLPIATPPNAIIADAANMKTIDMMKAGFMMNILTICVLLASFNTLGTVVYDLGEFPAWAEPLNSTQPLV